MPTQFRHRTMWWIVVQCWPLVSQIPTVMQIESLKIRENFKFENMCQVKYDACCGMWIDACERCCCWCSFSKPQCYTLLTISVKCTTVRISFLRVCLSLCSYACIQCHSGLALQLGRWSLYCWSRCDTHTSFSVPNKRYLRERIALWYRAQDPVNFLTIHFDPFYFILF